jgi:hypothetical protein
MFLLILEGIQKRLSGPGSFRFVLQPIIAIALGIRDGLMDAKANDPPYLIGLVFHPEYRREMWTVTVQHVLKPFIVGVVLDLILQYFIFQHVRLIPALMAGILLIGLPYALARGLTNRIATEWNRRRVARMTG